MTDRTRTSVSRAFAMLLALCGAACAEGPDVPAAAVGQPSAAMADAGSTTAVALPANFSIVSGSEARAAVVGQTGRVVVLNLWATWCPPCRAEFPALAELERKYRSRGVTVIALSVDETEDIDEKVRPFVEQVGADFSVLVKAPGDPRRFLTQLDRRLSGALPETVVYDREGKPAHVLAGEQSLEAFERAIRDLL